MEAAIPVVFSKSAFARVNALLESMLRESANPGDLHSSQQSSQRVRREALRLFELLGMASEGQGNPLHPLLLVLREAVKCRTVDAGMSSCSNRFRKEQLLLLHLCRLGNTVFCRGKDFRFCPLVSIYSPRGLRGDIRVTNRSGSTAIRLQPSASVAEVVREVDAYHG